MDTRVWLCVSIPPSYHEVRVESETIDKASLLSRRHDCFAPSSTFVNIPIDLSLSDPEIPYVHSTSSSLLASC
jgi:hypothetical protein